MLFQAVLSLTLFTAISTECLPSEKEIQHGRLVYEDENDANLTHVPDKYILRFQCDEGYRLTEPRYIFCIENNWSYSLPRCVKLNCPRPPNLEHGRFEIQKGSLTNPVIGSKAKYSCNSEYDLRIPEDNTLSCVLENGTAMWSGHLSSCINKLSCPDPGVSPDGKRTGPCCFVGSVVTYRCKRKYKLVGEESIICLLGGHWSSPRPRCRPENFCPDPPHIENGLVIGEKDGDYYSMYADVEIKCNAGFSFYGETKYVFCEENFVWDVEFGVCRETFCPRPPPLLNGTITELEMTNATEFADGFELTYHCRNGFRLIGDNTRQCRKGNWSNKEPYCEEIHCYSPGIPEDGMRKGDDFSVGSKVSYSCFSGFELIGSLERYCLPNGQWSGETPSCDLESYHCPNPGVPTNGKKNSSNYNENDVIEFSCSPGFKLVGSRFRQCLSNGTWSGEEPICVGAYDYDNQNKVREILQNTMDEKVKLQAAETKKYEATLSQVQEGDLRKRILDLTFPGRLIFYFLFDISGSVKKKNFLLSVKFAKELIKKVGITKHGARVGALTFSSKADVEFLPPQYETTEEVLAALDDIKFGTGGTATSNALQIVNDEMIPLTGEHFGFSTNIKSVVFIMTDGKANTGGNPKEKADILKEAEVEIYCIGITGDPKKNALYEIASKPHNEHVFILKDYKALDWLVQEISNGSIDYSKCGLGLHNAGKQAKRSRIYGGDIANDPWPWMAALYYRNISNPRSQSKLKCGGSIIGKQWILTAAHCLVDKQGNVRPLSDVIVRLGLKDIRETKKLQEYDAEKFIIHREYNFDNDDNDIALIKLKRAIEYNQDIRPLCLPPLELPPNTKFYKEGNTALVAGWGYEKKLPKGTRRPDGSSAKDLKEIVMPIQSTETCLDSLLQHNYEANQLTDSMFCAGKGDGSADACVGDSGGPLMQSNFNGGDIYWTQTGIVSWGLGCGQPNTYGIYTNVHRFVSWIDAKINDELN